MNKRSFASRIARLSVGLVGTGVLLLNLATAQAAPIVLGPLC